MFKRFNTLAIWALLFMMLSTSCSAKSPKYTPDRYAVQLETSKGKVILELYNETPQHRDNFIKLVEQHFYDGTLFHRVIKDFMVQAGDPETKSYDPSKTYGSGGPDYTVPAEFVRGLFHRKGALAAARLGDGQNPERASSGSQFYIVQGKRYTSAELDEMQNRLTHQQKLSAAQRAVQQYYQTNEAALRALEQEQFKAKIDSVGSAAYEKAEGFTFNDAEREAYTVEGGTPFLDNQYTVFGIVVEGLPVVDSIAGVATGSNDAPTEPVKILSAKVVHRPKGK